MAIAQRTQSWNKEDGLAEDAPERETQWISDPEVVMLMRQHSLELVVGEEVDRCLGNVDRGAQITGAERLRPRIVDHLDGGMSVERARAPHPSDEGPVRLTLAPARAHSDPNDGGAEGRQRDDEPLRAVQGRMGETQSGDYDMS